MIRFLIKDFFKTLQLPSNSLDLEVLSNTISNSSLKNELIKQKQFYTSWRNEFNLTMLNERYKIIHLQFLKSNKVIKVCATIKHSFKFNNFPNKIESQELQYYIFIIKKNSNKKMIFECCNKELNPALYTKLLNADDTFFLDTEEQFNNFFRESSRVDFWNDKISTLKEMSATFHKYFPIYRTFYSEEVNSNYDNLAAIRYAKRYALSYNKNYISYDSNGGDCTNFVSQCINAGNLSTSSIWKPYTHPWLRVNELYYYLLRNNCGIDITTEKHFSPGSIIQFYSSKKNYFSHSGIITESLANGDYLYCCHSYDKLDFPLSEIFPIYYDKFRVIKIL